MSDPSAGSNSVVASVVDVVDVVVVVVVDNLFVVVLSVV